ncbi:MAG TPA: PQQ-binding-like beta-propeller repeat protein [Candidatus Acidoferrales bacterium]|nr:PQQ-binding-like beta-propeller repeat protein [Candidatus Acidoferrales bacterium]
MIFRLRVVAFLAVASFAASLPGSGGRVARATVARGGGYDWPMMGFNVQGDNASPWSTGITAANVKTLRLQQVPLDGTVDASAIYLHGVAIEGAVHDVFFVTTTYGKTIAVDADSGTILWEYTPPQYANWAGTPQITNSTPAADPDRHYIYAATPGGEVVKLAIADGHAIWSSPVTLAPRSEKISAPLKVFRGHVIAVTGGYIGDRPPYQGHVAIVDASSGKLLNVWNSLCSNRSGLLQPASCDGQQSAIWGKSGPAIDEATGDIFVATGNGSYDGKTNWGDSLLEINASATKMVGNYTPADNADINRRDLDLGATSPVLMGDGVVAQGGKDALIRLVSIKDMAGSAPHADHELQTVSTPGGLMLLTSLAKWTHNGRTWLFSADYGVFRPGGGASAWTYAKGHLTPAWKNDNPGTSPVVAGGLLYIYDGPGGGLHVYNPQSGELLADLRCGKGHWNTPIVADGRIALPEGLTVGWVRGQGVAHNNTPGILDIWSLPERQN